MMVKFWLVYVEGSDGGKHFKHLTRNEAESEAERIAVLPRNCEKRVYVLEAKACCVIHAPVEWTRV